MWNINDPPHHILTSWQAFLERIPHLIMDCIMENMYHMYINMSQMKGFYNS
jgi:hypothetical protein